ncbi:terpenoid synthase [Tricholoma matsutake]|nr:terpenoid synthase [Tricholoma matsutake 945]
MDVIKNRNSTSGHDRASMKRCWELLDKTGKSFPNAIRDVDGDLAQVLCIYYLVLRGLDTIEDDMTLPNDLKQSMLRSFHVHTVTPGWNFEGSGPTEKDRILLVEYQNVIEELNLLAPEYKSIILDTTQKMEVGMADYAQAASERDNSIFLTTIANYNQYCHYVGGIVGQTLPRTFALAGKGPASTELSSELTHAWSLFFQKVDLIHDYREDVDGKRYLWPEEIWSRQEYGFNAIWELHEAVDADGGKGTSEKAKKAVYVLSEMVVDALGHITDGMDYLTMMTDKGLIIACARVLCLGIAYLDLCFMNREVFLGEVKFKNGEFDKIMSSSPTVYDTAMMLCEYVRKILAKADVSDPNFLQLSIACEKIEQWGEYHYPSHGEQNVRPNVDARTPFPCLETEHDLQLAREKRLRAKVSENGVESSLAEQSLVENMSKLDLNRTS